MEFKKSKYQIIDLDYPNDTWPKLWSAAKDYGNLPEHITTAQQFSDYMNSQTNNIDNVSIDTLVSYMLSIGYTIITIESYAATDKYTKRNTVYRYHFVNETKNNILKKFVLDNETT